MSAHVRPVLVVVVAVLVGVLAPSARTATAAGALSFSNTPLLRPDGNSEPAISIDHTGTMAITGLQWNFDSTSFGTNLWTGSFGTTPPFRGLLDNQIYQPGKGVFGAGDADVDLGSTGTLHATTLLFFYNPTAKAYQLGIAAITCPGGTSSTFSTAGCTRQIIDTSGVDRPWISSDGPHVYISYRDSKNATLIHMVRSDDDGYTWRRVGDPITGQGGTTADSTFNSVQGQVVVDPTTHDVFAVYASGVTGYLKAHTFTPNHIFVARSTDMGKTWSPSLVYEAPDGTDLANLFPTLAVDPTNGKLYAGFSDGQNVYMSVSSDHGNSWSPAVTINAAPASTAEFPAIAAYHGTVDVAYYGTADSNALDTAAVWNTFMSQTTNDGASFQQSEVTGHPNHVGPLCTQGDACSTGTRNLLDLFEVAIDPLNGRAAIAYVDDTLTTTPAPNYSCLPSETTCPLPQVVLAQQTH